MSKYYILLLTMMLPAAGGSFVYTSLSAWQASSPGITTALDFESTSPAYFGLFSSGVFSITSTGSGLYVLNGAAAGTGSGHYLTTSGGTDLIIALAAGVYGLAFNLGSNFGAAATASIVATETNGVTYTTSAFTESGPAGPAAFWGLRNDAQLSSVRIVYTSTIQPQVDNLWFSNTSLPPQGPGIPEPGTSWLAGSGIALLLFTRGLTRDPQNHRRQAHK
jgi:hypothetical protein